MKSKKVTIVILVMVLISQGVIYFTFLHKRMEQRNPYKEQIEIQRKQIEKLEEELNEWRNHSKRMKKIIGIEHEGDITWIDKVSNPIDTKALNRMKISKR
jgi:5-bromo-4-chloroindolyl phosphate hydrolysis protein